MTQYHIGDRLLFASRFETYHIREGDTAEIKAEHGATWCVYFDRNVGGHNCNIPHLIPEGHGWFISNDVLDGYATVINEPDETDILSVDLEEIL